MRLNLRPVLKIKKEHRCVFSARYAEAVQQMLVVLEICIHFFAPGRKARIIWHAWSERLSTRVWTYVEEERLSSGNIAATQARRLCGGFRNLNSSRGWRGHAENDMGICKY